MTAGMREEKVAVALSRRQVLGGLVALGLVGTACRRFPAGEKRARPWFDHLPEDRQQTLIAAVDRILPGAAAAGALTYIDYWLTHPPFEFAAREFDTATLLLTRTAMQRFKKSFVAAAPSEQDAVLKEFELGSVKGKHFDGRDWFKRLVTLTVESFLGDPKYGGNQGQVGWHLIGWHACWYSPNRIDQLTPKQGRLPY
jgi:hypothetical protein